VGVYQYMLCMCLPVNLDKLVKDYLRTNSCHDDALYIQ
jgi:hypothetical protein